MWNLSSLTRYWLSSLTRVPAPSALDSLKYNVLFSFLVCFWFLAHSLVVIPSLLFFLSPYSYPKRCTWILLNIFIHLKYISPLLYCVAIKNSWKTKGSFSFSCSFWVLIITAPGTYILPKVISQKGQKSLDIMSLNVKIELYWEDNMIRKKFQVTFLPTQTRLLPLAEYKHTFGGLFGWFWEWKC